MSKGTTHTVLLFDSACNACSVLAREVERVTEGLLVARSLHESEVQVWLTQARPGWHWEPMLLEVNGERSRAFRGLGMALRLVRILGLRRVVRLARLVQRAPIPTSRMHEERRQFLRYSGGMLLTLLGTSIVAACGSSTTSSAPSPTSARTAKVTGEFVARDLTAHTWVGLSTDGQQVTAYACDGDAEHPGTFAQWFKGNVTNNTIDLTNANSAHLTATLTSQTATGTVNLPGGTSFPFTANAITNSKAGLYRSELTLGGVTYLAGWVVPESAVAAAPTGGLVIKMEPRTSQLLTAPTLSSQDISAGQVVVSGLGTFKLTQCHLGTCS